MTTWQYQLMSSDSCGMPLLCRAIKRFRSQIVSKLTSIRAHRMLVFCGTHVNHQGHPNLEAVTHLHWKDVDVCDSRIKPTSAYNAMSSTICINKQLTSSSGLAVAGAATPARCQAGMPQTPTSLPNCSTAADSCQSPAFESRPRCWHPNQEPPNLPPPSR